MQSVTILNNRKLKIHLKELFHYSNNQINSFVNKVVLISKIFKNI